jgi:hypothetical protein
LQGKDTQFTLIFFFENLYIQIVLVVYDSNGPINVVLIVGYTWHRMFCLAFHRFRLTKALCWSVFIYIQIDPTTGGGFPGQQVFSQSNLVIIFFLKLDSLKL